ncbi:MAG: hypothetical protein M1831_003184 [Alyxoria varia]|nr:MAG: hypothetical protein M1831_003184 [Alyxoria varia]
MARTNSAASNANGSNTSSQISRFGVLSKTEFQSPDVRFILPARRIRKGQRNDVILVCENALFVKEILDNRRLSHVAEETNFDSRILAASVLTLDRQTNENTSKGSGDPNSPSSSSIQPDQVLVMSFVSPPRISFLAFAKCSEKAHRCRMSTEALPSLPRGENILDDLGQLLAIDPYSRALAVASRSNRVYLLQVISNKDINSPAKDIIGRGRYITSQLTDISKMDFLYTSRKQTETVYLLLVGHRNKKCHMELISWRPGEDHDQPDSCELINLSNDHDIPMILAPLEKVPGAFLLACNRSIAIYDGCFRANVRHLFRKAVHQSAVREDKELFNVRHSQQRSTLQEACLWKSWARALRDHGDVEWIYLARQDGVVCYLTIELSLTGEEIYAKSGDAGQLGGHVDHAFAYVVSYGPDAAYDALLFSGDLCDGGLFQIGFPKTKADNEPARMDVMSLGKTDVLYNWSPIIDAAVLPTSSPMSALYPNDPSSSRSDSVAKKRIFTTSGKDPYGSITELRYGCEMSLDQNIAIDDDATPTKLWVFKVHVRREQTTHEPARQVDIVETLLVISMPTRTSILSDIYHSPQMDVLCENETLAMQELLNRQPRTMIQVKANALSILHIRKHRPNLVESSTYELPSKISHAAVDQYNGFILMSSRNRLMLKQLTAGNELHETADVPECEADITTISILSLESDSMSSGFDNARLAEPRAMHAAVGLASGVVYVFELDPKDGLVEVLKFDATQPGMDQSISIPESIDMITSSACSEWTMLCGMRDGRVHALRVHHNDQERSYHVVDTITISVGLGPVELTRIFQNPSAVIAQCGGSAVYLNYDGRNLYEPTIMPIWITNGDQRSFSPGSVGSFLQIPELQVEYPSKEHKDTGKFLFLSSEGISIGLLEEHAKPAPRQFRVPGTPTRILYSMPFKCVFVASRIVKHKGTDRFNISALYSVDIHDSAEDSPGNGNHHNKVEMSPVYVMDNGLDLLSLSDFVCREDSGKSYFVVLGARDNRRRKEKGVLHFLKVKKDEDGDFEVDPARVKKYEENHPVLTTCGYDRNILLYGSGPNLMQATISTAISRYDSLPECERRKLHTFNSDVVQISVTRPFVYISTTEHSLSVFRYGDNEFKPFTHDDTARPSLCNLPLQTANFVLFTDNHQKLAGMYHGSEPTIRSITKPVFEAKLHRPVRTLRKINSQQPWKMKQVEGIIERDIIGTATDGSLFAFSILTERLWRLLGFIQNLCKADPSICTVTKPISGQASGFEPASKGPKDFHVDGDILKRLLDVSNPYDNFKQLLSNVGRSEHTSNQANGELDRMADDRRRRLTELVNDYQDDTNKAGNEPNDATEITRRRLERTMAEDDTISKALQLVYLALESPF